MREETPRNESRPAESEYGAAQGRGAAALGDAESVLAAVPGCLESFSSSMQEVLQSCLVESAAEELRRLAQRKSNAGLHFPDHLDWLVRTGFIREDTRQIRYVVEEFCRVEPVHALLTACALEWVARRLTAPEVSREQQCLHQTSVTVNGRIELVDDSTSPDCLLQFAGRWDRPCHSLFRALAVWPTYLGRVGDDLEQLVKADEFDLAVETLRETAKGLCGSLPFSGNGTGFDTNLTNLGDALDRCLSLSCEALIICVALRRMFILAERNARSGRHGSG